MEKLNLSILYVEDDRLTQKLIAGFLKNNFEKVIVADNGEQGLQLFRKHNPDLVITDISMPIMSGLEMIAAIRQSNNDVNCIITSSNQETNQFVKAIELGINSFLIKPIDPKKLLEQISRINHGLLLQHKVQKQNALILENEKRYRSLFESAPVGIVIVDQDGEILEFNNKLLKNLHVEKNQSFPDLNIYEFIPFINSGISASFMQCIESNQGVEKELHYSLKTGKSIDISISIAPINIHGSKVLYQAIIDDISERKQYEIALRESEERYRALFDNAPTGIGIVTRDMEFIIANSTLGKMLQFSDNEIKGLNLSTLLCRSELQYEISRQLMIEGKLNAKEVELTTKGGECLWAMLTIFPVEIGGKNVYLSALQDITNIKRSEYALLRKNKINKAISDVSTMLLTSKNINATINHSLAVIGKVRKASRAFLYIFEDENGAENKYFEWNNPNSHHENKPFVDVSTNSFPYLMSKLWKGEDVFVNSINKLPDEARTLRERMVELGVQSVVIIPIHFNGSLFGFLGIEHEKAKEFWTPDDLPSLKTVSIILSTALIKNEQDQLLRINEERLDMAITNSNDGLWDWDIVTGKTYFSPRWLDMLGFDQYDIPPAFSSWENLIDSHDLKRFNHELKDHVTGKSEYFEGEYKMISKSGDRIWVLMRGRIVEWNREGKPSRMVGIQTDITARKQAEEKISYQKSLLDSVINNIPDPIFYKTINGEYFGHNKSFAEFVGKGSDKIIGKFDIDLFPVELARFFRESDQELLKHKTSYKHKEWSTFPDGKRVFLETIKTPFYNPEGEILGLLGVSRDLTENMNNLEALKSSEDRYRGLIQSQNDLVVRISSDMKFTFANDAYCKKFSLEPGAILGTDFKMFTDAKEADFITQSLVNLEKPPYRIKFEQQSKVNKQQNWILWEFYAIKDLYGKTVEIQGVGRDITYIKKTQEKLKQTNAELKKLHNNLERKVNEAVKELRERDHMLIKQSRQAAMGEMIGNIAHQWRQPINSLGLIVQNFKHAFDMGKMTPEYIDNKVKKITELIDFMSDTIDDFRNFFQPNNDKISFNLKETVEKTLTFLDSNFAHNNIKVENRIEDDVMLKGFPNEFSQVILNILVNAKDIFLEKKIESPTITLGLSRQNSKTEVTITDNAGGIPDDIIHHIFEPYFTTKEQGKGTGLGLYMSKSIIEKNMGGQLSVCNKNGGAEFKIEV